MMYFGLILVLLSLVSMYMFYRTYKDYNNFKAQHPVMNANEEFSVNLTQEQTLELKQLKRKLWMFGLGSILPLVIGIWLIIKKRR